MPMGEWLLGTDTCGCLAGMGTDVRLSWTQVYQRRGLASHRL